MISTVTFGIRSREKELAYLLDMRIGYHAWAYRVMEWHSVPDHGTRLSRYVWPDPRRRERCYDADGFPSVDRSGRKSWTDRVQC